MDGIGLLEAVWDRGAPAWLRELAAVEVLRQVWVQQDQVVDGQVRFREAGDLPASWQVQSPDDPQARYRCKRQLGWVGYKDHVTKTCQPDTPHLITNVETTLAPVPDVKVTARVHKGLAARGLLPGVHLVDGGYVDAELLLESQTADQVARPGGDGGWQARAGQGFELASFTIDWAAERVVCPKATAVSSGSRTATATARRGSRSASPRPTVRPVRCVPSAPAPGSGRAA